MIGDKRITLLAFFAAAFLHLVALLLASYTPWRLAELNPPALPTPTRYVVRFQQPVSTAVPTSVPDRPETAQPIDPVLPQVAPQTRQPVPMSQPMRIREQITRPTNIEVQRPEPLEPVEVQIQPRPPTPSQTPVRVDPLTPLPKIAEVQRLKPLDPVQPAKPVAPRKPSAVKIPRQRPKRVVTPKPPTPPARKAPPPAAPPVAAPKTAPPRMPVTPRPAAPPAVRPAQPAAPSTPDLQRQYLALVSAALKRHKRYPRTARRRGLSGKVVLTFVILPNGQVTNARIAESNGHAILNNAALRALRRATPLPPFPPALKRPSLPVTIPIMYELTEK